MSGTDVSITELKEDRVPSISLSTRGSLSELDEDSAEDGESSGNFFVSEFPPFRADVGFDEADERKYENTYLLEPKVKIKPTKLKEITQRVLENNLEGKQYEYNGMRALSADISLLMRNEIKELGYERYKIVACVTIGEKMGQGVTIVNQNLWDTTKDYIAYGSFENNSLFATAVVAVMYKT